MGQRYLFQCESCGARFYLDNGDVEIKYGVPFRASDGRSIFITYYDCPKCDRRHYVQIDDVHSNQMKREVTAMFRKLSKKRMDFKDIPKSQNEKFKKLNKKLEDYRFELKKKYNLQNVRPLKGSESEVEVEIHFSV